MTGRTGPKLATLALAAVVLVASTASSCLPEPRPATRPSQPVTGVPGGGGDAPEGERRSRLAVPPGFGQQALGFVDASTGYAFFTACPDRCQGALYVTFDGGVSWLERTLPIASAESFRLDVVDATTLVITAAPGRWYLSRDSGRTFTLAQTPPKELGLVGARAQVRCPTGDNCPVQVVRAGVPVPVRPPLPGELRAAAQGREGPLWAVSVQDGAVSTARSGDGGRTWQRFGTPVTPPDASHVRLAVSPDGRDAWLLTGAGAGPVAVNVAGDAGWRQVMPKLDLGSGPVVAAAAGGGALATGGGEFGFVLADGRWWSSDPPRRVQGLVTLDDGTVVAHGNRGEVWLGAGTGGERKWTHVVVEAA